MGREHGSEWEGSMVVGVGGEGVCQCECEWGGRSIEMSGEGVWEQYTDAEEQCIIVNANQRTENGVGQGTKLHIQSACSLVQSAE